MVRLPDLPPKKRRKTASGTSAVDSTKQNCWYSAHQPLTDQLELLRSEVKEETFILRPAGAEEFKDDISAIKPDVYYVPEKANVKALDSFIFHGPHLYIFQFTIAAKHDIKAGLVPFFSNLEGVPSMNMWRLLFVIPPGQVLICPYSRNSMLQNLQPYTTLHKLK